MFQLFHQNADALSRRPCRSSCPCTVPEPDSSSNQRQHKGIQCTLTNPPEQALVGVVNVSSSSCDHPSVNRVSETPQAELLRGWTQEQLKGAQMADVDIAPLCMWFEKGEGRPTWTDVAPCSPATKAYWAQWKRLYQKDGVILRKFYCTEGKVF
ncbi:uncharacterized protein AKAME5_002312500 [Lates japonicus]|uniref:Uncharacterized protein n=1 Tax=Lates japonicus TaxID=270547 RepID=A0AAD3NF51_LATJO|nr:uncharacterized protein AKAME5_002312500 [Lates japonicus]